MTPPASAFTPASSRSAVVRRDSISWADAPRPEGAMPSGRPLTLLESTFLPRGRREALGCLFDEMSDHLRLRDVHGMASLDFNDRRSRTL